MSKLKDFYRRVEMDDDHEAQEEDVLNDLEREDARGEFSMSRRTYWTLWGIFIALAVLLVAFFIRYCNPYVTDAAARGYITTVERRGIIFKTFEGQMISEEALTDTTRLYSRDVSFSIPNDSLAIKLRDYQGTGRPVEIHYSLYWGVLPWRGASKMIVTGIK